MSQQHPLVDESIQAAAERLTDILVPKSELSGVADKAAKALIQLCHLFIYNHTGGDLHEITNCVTARALAKTGFRANGVDMFAELALETWLTAADEPAAAGHPPASDPEQQGPIAFKPITLERLLELLKELVSAEDEKLNAQLLELVAGLATAGYETGAEDKFDLCVMAELGAEYIFSKMDASKGALWRYGIARGFIYASREEEARALGRGEERS